MAPEFPPKLVIFDARWDGNVLKGALEYVEASDGAESKERLRVHWAIGDRPPQDYLPVGGGVAYVGPGFYSQPISENADATFLGDSRYQWAEGLQFGLPWLMFVLILPKGFTLDDPRPRPVGTKIFQDRLALYWSLEGNKLGRTTVEATIKTFQGDIKPELIRINKAYLSSDPGGIVEEKPAENNAKVATHRSPWSSGSFFLLAFVVILAGLFVVAKYTPPWSLPLLIIGAVLILSVVGAFQLKQDDLLSEKSFLQLMLLTFQRLPLLTKGQHGPPRDKSR